MAHIKHISDQNPIYQVSPRILSNIELAQSNIFSNNFISAFEFVRAVITQLRLGVAVPQDLQDLDAQIFSNQSFRAFVRYYTNLLQQQKYPEQAIPQVAVSLASRTMLVRAFPNPDHATRYVRDKVIGVVSRFPRTAKDIERGRNRGDVLDPFILAATQYLIYQGEFEGAIAATVSHKALMMVEGLMGHLHEDVIGMMRGNVRVPEPRGREKEDFDYELNPFPGADILQPPATEHEKIAFHQIKSKTGSAKGGDGKRLGDQLHFLAQHYDADIYYDALVGNTLVGHRSKAGVERAAPSVRVLVGQAAFQHLTKSSYGASFLLRLYHEAFIACAQESGYSVNEVTKGIVETFQSKATKADEGFLDTILISSTNGIESEQDSLYFNKKV
ncbi:MAG: hypothetical protein AAF639_41325 [Chloroflexota bacterium]